MKADQERAIMSRYDFRKPVVKLVYGFVVLAIALVSLSMLYPFVNTVLNSLKSTEEFFEFPAPFFPSEWQWSNYTESFSYLNILLYFKNTVLIFVGNTVFSMVVLGLAAYSLSHMQVPFKKGVTLYFMCTLLIPAASYLIPNFLNLKDLGLLNQYWAFWLPAGANAFYLMLLKNFFDGIHKEMLEAARIDGASELRCFATIAVPLSVPILITITLLGFSTTWNDFYWSSLVMQEDKQPLAAAIYTKIIYAGSTINWNVRFAILSMTLLPPAVLFLFFQKYIVGGLSAGAVKG
ncbi:carbohydrate ABC transporter permease [Paenibacillus methanolicus]|uniref:Multiple sugar transport system permease protein n=1 Tax=Paenibacillus methanolicus TaxID=582686 RepID=A0A5S5BY17_9BACL|nr:carbohydrate ABC transporter permease [Paenibacillus methanolicus]TYP71937.1 multiple sugar transport system permease protein [Paenibacillus methanolicus]